MITVHQFRVWDQSAGDHVIAPRKATAEFINAARGEAIPGTAEEVDASEVDAQGQVKQSDSMPASKRPKLLPEEQRD